MTTRPTAHKPDETAQLFTLADFSASEPGASHRSSRSGVADGTVSGAPGAQHERQARHGKVHHGHREDSAQA